MEIKTMTVDELLARKEEIAAEVDSLEDIEAVQARSAELEEISGELEARKAMAEAKAEIREAVATGDGVVIEKIVKEEKKMTIDELRNSPEYIDAYAEYIKTNDDTELRNMLTTVNDTTPSGTATIPVPVFVYEITKTAWEREGITSRVRKAYLKGNLKVGFEISGSAATVHAEGAAAISAEDLVLGVVELVPKSIKKFVP